MISIGGVILSDDLLLPGLKNIPLRATSVRYTMAPAGARAVHQSKAISNGQELTLVDPGPYGAFTGTQIDQLNAFRASGETVEFVHHLGSWQVIIDAVDVEQTDGYANSGNDDTYSGTITMFIKG